MCMEREGPKPLLRMRVTVEGPNAPRLPFRAEVLVGKGSTPGGFARLG